VLQSGDHCDLLAPAAGSAAAVCSAHEPEDGCDQDPRTGYGASKGHVLTNPGPLHPPLHLSEALLQHYTCKKTMYSCFNKDN